MKPEVMRATIRGGVATRGMGRNVHCDVAVSGKAGAVPGHARGLVSGKHVRHVKFILYRTFEWMRELNRNAMDHWRAKRGAFARTFTIDTRRV